MRIEEIMAKAVHVCEPDDRLDRVAQLMWEHDIGCLPVCLPGGGSSRRAVGMITDRDVCMSAMFKGRSLSDLRVSDAMARKLLACHPGDSLEEAEKIMRDGRIRRLPVVNETGCLLGMISLADLAREAARESAMPMKSITETEVGDTLAAICAPGH